MAVATMRAFGSVKSSSITPRHPSVPNLMEVIVQKLYARNALRGRTQKLPDSGLRHSEMANSIGEASAELPPTQMVTFAGSAPKLLACPQKAKASGVS